MTRQNALTRKVHLPVLVAVGHCKRTLITHVTHLGDIIVLDYWQCVKIWGVF